MTNIWEFLLQTLTLSLVALLLLLAKRLLRDSLSPRWQYGIWGILALRVLLPAQAAGSYLLLPLPLWVETVKGMAEAGQHSAYAAVSPAIAPRHPFALFHGVPVSVSDWLFVLYGAGVLAVLLHYLLSYFRLRNLLRRGAPLSAERAAQIAAVGARYGLKTCPAVEVAGLPSAFICGVLRPILALPAGEAVDDKVLLHELLHLRSRDALQSIFWCFCRALHWCNPFLLAVFDRVGNDMESLCDQRVLERLEGEERRAYGGILLTMANVRYPRAAGTSSLSNGGKNIARRIAAIVRFRCYPRGMALASVCVGIVLLSASFYPTMGQGIELHNADDSWDFARALASARLTRCTTVAGALDTYAKGLLTENGLYLMAASPVSEQAALAEEMRQNGAKGECCAGYVDRGFENANLQSGYAVYNLKKNSDFAYEALLVFALPYFETAAGEPMQNADGRFLGGARVLPVALQKSAGGWYVSVCGLQEDFPIHGVGSTVGLEYGLSALPALARYEAVGKTGTVTLALQTVYVVQNKILNSRQTGFDFLENSVGFDQEPKPNAEFYDIFQHYHAVYTLPPAQWAGLQSAAFATVPLGERAAEPDFSEVKMGSGDSSGGGSDGSGWSSRTVRPDWDGIITSGGGGSGYGREALSPPAGYGARCYRNGKLAETLILKEVAADGAQ